jgi:hypothetical protein
MISATALVLIGTPDCALHNMSTHMMLPEDLYKPRTLDTDDVLRYEELHDESMPIVHFVRAM